MWISCLKINRLCLLPLRYVRWSLGRRTSNNTFLFMQCNILLNHFPLLLSYLDRYESAASCLFLSTTSSHEDLILDHWTHMPRSFELSTRSMVTHLTLNERNWAVFFLKDIIISFVVFPLILVLLSTGHSTLSLTSSCMVESAGSITSSVMVELYYDGLLCLQYVNLQSLQSLYPHLLLYLNYISMYIMVTMSYLFYVRNNLSQ